MSACYKNVNQLFLIAVSRTREISLAVLQCLKKLTVSTSILGCLVLSSNNTLAYEVLPFKDKVLNDYTNFYRLDHLTRIAGVGALAGITANTNLDQEIHDWYQEDVRSERTDSFSKTVKYAGEGMYLLPLSILASQLINFDSNSQIGGWGSDVARAYTLGLPLVLSTQHISGASRPKERDGSNWRPFNDSNGVSGHAFVGAVPFLAVARNTDNVYMKYFAYFASGLTAWSRVNDEAHYASQSLLGWYFAYEVMDAIHETNSTNNEKSYYSILPIMSDDSVGVSVSFVW
ncbi:phosphatase PAP2 family protein [Marinomonas sp. RSW2]|uniref:Phosphatase PAP2 family protein n=1 Tax=Marinomonas maritima TaxID=2940935 RepID=A0ABT5WBW0_9GAMM|nr:phosphatase PAP2 family protein [Marinomonas maritima]MDE8601545.1 phosphatase PAP2 family protein [Marinomonas maritima]